MTGALEGIKVLDCSQIIAGPLAASLLTEMGANVVKVEALEGEPWRLQAEVVSKESRNFLAQNRGKRGVALDFKNPASHEARDVLLRWADVVISNYRPGAAKALGIDYDSVRALNPSVIYCYNTAFGPEGPDASRRGYDIIAQAMSGLMTSNAVYKDGLPQVTGFAPADALTGAVMAWSITAALYHRLQTGEGQVINASLLSSSLYLQPAYKEIVALDEADRRARLEQLTELRAKHTTIEQIDEARRAAMPEIIGNIYYRAYQTANGYIAIGCLGPAPRLRLQKALGIHDPRYDAGFDTSLENMRRVGDALVERCEALFRSKTSAEWLAILDAHDVASGPVRFADELWDDPQVLANGYRAEYDHMLLGPLRDSGPIVSMSATPTRVQRASPALGEHSEEVLREVGLSDDKIATLFDAGALRQNGR
jgi:crotonobetainyl-CoA:carnitine CoA-transferase CaiB-like acyl-CoA transferase